MIDGRSRVTVVGAGKRLDVAVPAGAPIGEYVTKLAEACGHERRGHLPRAWSLHAAGTAPFPLDASLAQSGVTDGQVLYLCDLATDPAAEPVIEDIEELVGAQAQAQRRRSLPRGLV